MLQAVLETDTKPWEEENNLWRNCCFTVWGKLYTADSMRIQYSDGVDNQCQSRCQDFNNNWASSLKQINKENTK